MRFAASEAATLAVDRLRSEPWGLAVAVAADGDVEVVLDPGADDLEENSYFQIGSVTKTMTGLLVACCITRGEASLDTTVGSILGDDAGKCGRITLLDLVTQHSGLAREPPNLDRASIDPKDPYVSYAEMDLLAALRIVDKPARTPRYSNFGFMLLGLLLGRLTGTTYAELLRTRVFEPLGMTKAICGIPSEEERMPGYEGGAPTTWWHAPLPGADGVGCSIRDLSLYIAGCLSAPDSLKEPIELALAAHAPGPPPVMGMGWIHGQGGGHWHSGGTGGFRSFIAIHRETQTGVALLANSHDVYLDATGFAVLTKLVQSRE